MSILIKGMEMPKGGHTVTITIVGSGQAYVEYYDCRPHVEETIEYTAVPVPPHGRMIDADALFDFILNIYKTAQGDARKAYRDVLDTIVAAGDVIPAEEGET